MDPAHQLLGLIQQLYAAPGTTRGWYTFLESLRVSLHGSAASFISQNLDSDRGSISVSAQVDPDASTLDDQRWPSVDPWACSPKFPQISHRLVVVGDELVGHADFNRAACEHVARHYDTVGSVAGVVELGPEALSVISVNGSEHRDPFGEDDAALLESLVPHIRRALQLHRRLVAADSASEDFASVIDSSPRAVMLVGGGKVIFMNQAATRLIGMRDGLTMDDGELRAARVADTSRLRSLLADASETTTGQSIGTGGVLALGRSSGRRPLIVLVCPVSRRRPLLAHVEAAAAIVFVTDPEQVVVPGEDTIRTVFALTPAEAKLTRLLAQGATLTEAAARLDVTRETIRTRVKTIFEKTNTHRQAELVRLVLSAMPQV